MFTEKSKQVDSEGPIAVMIPLALDPVANEKAVWYSSPPKTPADKGRFLAALTGGVEKLANKINTTIKVVDVIFQGVVITDDDTGEVNPAVRTIIVQANGQLLACTSAGIHQSFGMIFQLWGRPPYKPPLPLRVKQIETGNGRRFFVLEYAGSEKPVETDDRA